MRENDEEMPNEELGTPCRLEPSKIDVALEVVDTLSPVNRNSIGETLFSEACRVLTDYLKSK